MAHLRSMFIQVFVASFLFSIPSAAQQNYMTACGPAEAQDRGRMHNIALWRTEIDSRIRHERYLVDKAYIHSIENPSLPKVPLAPAGTRPPKNIDPKSSPPKKTDLSTLERLRNFFIGKRGGSPVTTDFLVNAARPSVPQIYQTHQASGWQIVIQKISDELKVSHPNVDHGVATAIAKYLLIEHLRLIWDGIYVQVVTDLDRWDCLRTYVFDVNIDWAQMNVDGSFAGILDAREHFDGHLQITFPPGQLELTPFVEFAEEARDVAIGSIPHVQNVNAYAATVKTRYGPLERNFSTSIASTTWGQVNGDGIFVLSANEISNLEEGIQSIDEMISNLRAFPQSGSFDDDDVEEIIAVIASYSIGAQQVYEALSSLRQEWIIGQGLAVKLRNTDGDFLAPIDSASDANLASARANMGRIEDIHQEIDAIN